MIDDDKDPMLDSESNDIGNDMPDEEEVTSIMLDSSIIWTCEICGATKTKAGSDFGSWTSLRSHISRSHRVSMTEEDYHNGDWPEDEGVHPPAKRKKTKTVKEKVPISPLVRTFTPEPILEDGEDKEEEEEPAPTELEQLYQILKEQGVSNRTKIINAISRSNIDPRDIGEVMFVIKDYGVPKARLKIIIDNFASWIDEPLPDEVVEVLGDSPTRRLSRRSQRWGGTPWDRRQEEEEDDSEEPDVAAQMVGMANAFSKIYRTFQPDQHSSGSNSVKEELREMRAEMRQRDREEMDRLRDENKDLKEERKREKEKNTEQIVMETLSRGVGKIGDGIEKGFQYIFRPRERAPTRESMGSSNVADMVAQEQPGAVMDMVFVQRGEELPKTEGRSERVRPSVSDVEPDTDKVVKRSRMSIDTGDTGVKVEVKKDE